MADTRIVLRTRGRRSVGNSVEDKTLKTGEEGKTRMNKQIVSLKHGKSCTKGDDDNAESRERDVVGVAENEKGWRISERDTDKGQKSSATELEEGTHVPISKA